MYEELSNLILAANVGIMIFFTIAVAPTIFTILPQEWAAKYVRAFFPKYYAVLGVTTALSAILAGTVAFRLALIACAFFFFFSQFWITPTVNRARDEGRERTFKTLHTFSVVINMLQLAVFIWILYANFRHGAS